MKIFQGVSPESQGLNLVLTVVCAKFAPTRGRHDHRQCLASLALHTVPLNLNTRPLIPQSLRSAHPYPPLATLTFRNSRAPASLRGTGGRPDFAASLILAFRATWLTRNSPPPQGPP